MRVVSELVWRVMWSPRGFSIDEPIKRLEFDVKRRPES